MKRSLLPYSICIVLLILTTSVAGLQAQTDGAWRFSQAPGFRHIQALQIFDEDRILTVGGNEQNDSISTIAVTTNSAMDWGYVEDRPNPMLRDVSFPSATVGYIAGWDGVFKKTTDSGNSWSKIDLAGNFASRDYNACWFFTEQTGILVGGNEFNDAIQTILKTTDGGQNWGVVRDNLAPWLRDLAFLDQNLGLAVGDQNAILRTTDGGDNWTDINPPMGLNPRRLNAVYFKDNTTCYIVGGHPSQDSIQTLLMSQDAGLSWSIVTDGLGSMLNDIAFKSADQGYIAGDDGLLWSTEDGGNSWNQVMISTDVNDTISDIRTIEFYSENFGVFGGQWGKVLIYDDRQTFNLPLVTTAGIIKLDEQSVQLEGVVDPNGSETEVYFEYGLTPDLGDSIAADQSPLMDAGEQSVSATISGLTEDAKYYYRVRATNTEGTSRGAIRFFRMSLSSIPNWNFEFWDSTVYETPNDWLTLGEISTVTSYDNSIALRLQGGSSDAGLLLKGAFGSMGPVGGVPFTSRPDTFSGYFNYDIQPGDAALIWLILKDISGAHVVDSIYMISGNSGGNFEKLDFGLDYKSAANVDTLLLVILSTNPFAGGNSNSVLILDNLSFSNNSEPIVNGDFESISSQTVYKPQDWKFRDRQSTEPIPVERSDVRHSGKYALKLQNTRNDYGKVGLREENLEPAVPAKDRYSTFNGYLMWMPEGDDTLGISVNMFENGVNVGWAYQTYSQSISNFEGFELDISYQNSTVVPDSLNVIFQIFNQSNGDNPPLSYAIIDNLSFDGFLLRTEEFDSDLEMSIYPNPTSGNLTIEIPAGLQQSSDAVLMLSDLNGRVMLTRHLYPHDSIIELNLAEWTKGFYMLTLSDGQSVITKKILLMQ